MVRRWKGARGVAPHIRGEKSLCLGKEENMVWPNSTLQLFEGQIQRWQKILLITANSFARGNSRNVQCNKMQLGIRKEQHQDRETDSILRGFQDSARQSHCWPDQVLKSPPYMRQVDEVIFRGPSNQHVHISVIHSLLYHTVISPAAFLGYLHSPLF